MTKFEKLYLDIRKKEGFLFNDEAVGNLPIPPVGDPQASKWKMRQKSSERILEYLRNHSQKDKSILDLGCGNGWFSAKLASLEMGDVFGWDVNGEELDQANRVFKNQNLHFKYQDIFAQDITHTFDFIILNSVLQYFESPDVLIKRLQQLLRPNGEIHILDSPFYAVEEVKDAQLRSKNYYKELGMPQMANFYHHHTLADLGVLNFDIMYDPNQFYKKIARKLGINDSPFIWLKIKIDS